MVPSTKGAATTLSAEHPLQRLGTPEDVAQAVLYLESDAASWITGVVPDVAGGHDLTAEQEPWRSRAERTKAESGR